MKTYTRGSPIARPAQKVGFTNYLPKQIIGLYALWLLNGRGKSPMPNPSKVAIMSHPYINSQDIY